MRTRIAGRLAIVFTALMTFLAVPAQAQIVAIGASNTAGKGVGASEAFPAQLEAMLGTKGRSMHVTNVGISGDTTGGMLARLSGNVPASTKIVILQFGCNDARRGLTGREGDIARIKSQLSARDPLHRGRRLRQGGAAGRPEAAGRTASDGRRASAGGGGTAAADTLTPEGGVTPAGAEEEVDRWRESTCRLISIKTLAGFASTITTGSAHVVD
jgi:acyl-CoA thioesterase I